MAFSLFGLDGLAEALVKIILWPVATLFASVGVTVAIDEYVVKPFLSYLREHPENTDAVRLVNQVKRAVTAAVLGLSTVVGLVVGVVELIELLT
jgi:hypothetical protein